MTEGHASMPYGHDPTASHTTVGQNELIENASGNGIGA